MRIDRHGIVGAVLLILAVFVSGVWLSDAGRPLNVVLMAVHQLVALGTAAYLAIFVYQTGQVAKLNQAKLTSVVITGLLFLVTGVVGGLLSTDQSPAVTLLRLHQVTPVLTAVSTAVTLILLRGRN